MEDLVGWLVAPNLLCFPILFSFLLFSLLFSSLLFDLSRVESLSLLGSELRFGLPLAKARGKGKERFLSCQGSLPELSSNWYKTKLKSNKSEKQPKEREEKEEREREQNEMVRERYEREGRSTGLKRRRKGMAEPSANESVFAGYQPRASKADVVE